MATFFLTRGKGSVPQRPARVACVGTGWREGTRGSITLAYVNLAFSLQPGLHKRRYAHPGF